MKKHYQTTRPTPPQATTQDILKCIGYMLAMFLVLILMFSSELIDLILSFIK